MICFYFIAQTIIYKIYKIKKDTFTSDWLTKKVTRATAYADVQKENVFTDSIRNPEQNVNKKRTKSWMQGLGLQLPSDATALGSIGSVTYKEGKVKIDSTPYNQYIPSGDKNTLITNQNPTSVTLREITIILPRVFIWQ